VNTEFFRLLRLGHIYFVGLCFALSLTLTTLAVFALWQRTDVIAGPVVIALLIITFALLFILEICSASFRRRLTKLREPQHEEQHEEEDDE
jgi:type VI protein secretion system component VasK